MEHYSRDVGFSDSKKDQAPTTEAWAEAELNFE